MKRWELCLAAAGLVCFLLGVDWIRLGALPRHDFTLDAGGCSTPVTLFAPEPGMAPAGSAVVLHGLSANRRIMMYLGEDFAGHGIQSFLLDEPGHGDSTEAFSYARAENCARAALEALTAQHRIEPAKTILVAHSMGGEIAIRMADRFPVAATIAISPAPMVLPQRMPANLLVFSAQFDVWALARQAAALQAAAGGDRTSQQDFRQSRAFDLAHVPLATHTSMLDDRAVAHRAELWAMQALFPKTDSKTLTLNLDLGTYEAFGRGRRRLAGALLGTLGVMLAIPLCVAVAGTFAGTKAGSAAARIQPSRKLVLAEVAAASLVAVLLLAAFNPLRFLHLYAGDYLFSVLTLVALALIALNREAARESFHATPRAVLVAAVFALGVLLGLGAWFNWQITDLWMNAPRWGRFALLLPFAFLFTFAEEAALGPLGRGQTRALRYFAGLALRGEIWLATLVAFFLLGNGQILLPILVLPFAAFSIAQRLASDALLGRTSSPTAVALFGAILAAWFAAAVFPIT